MQLNWTVRARGDLGRVHDFLAQKNKRAAAVVAEALAEAPDRLLLQPYIGQQIETIITGNVRRILIGDYEIRYAVLGKEITVLRIFHTRENR